ncbi:MAG: acyltransferase family protein [Candidatus Eiseniibacteriota bacterium]
MAADNSAVAPALEQRGPFLRHVHLFRGIAILLIVAVHLNFDYLHDVVGVQSPMFHHAVTINLILLHDTTIFFTLISGILYVHVYAGRGVIRFAKSRTANVILPYVVLSVVLTILRWSKGTLEALWMARPGAAGFAGWPGSVQRIGDDLAAPARLSALLERIGHNIATGEAWYHLWYLPVVVALYIASPLVYATVRSPRLRWLLAILIALPLIMPRIDETVSWSSIGYFLGVYALGMFVGCDLERWIDFIERRSTWFAAAAVAGTGALVALYATKMFRLGPIHLDEAAFYVQKTALAALLLVALRRWAQRPGRVPELVLGKLAAWALGIYFIHPLLMVPLFMVLERLISPSFPPWILGLDDLAAFAALIALCVAAIMLAHRVLGRRSRYLIGA